APGGRPLEHVGGAVRVAERRDGPAAGVHLDPPGLSGTAVGGTEFPLPREHRLAVLLLESRLEAAAHDLFRRNPVDPPRPGADELDAAPRDDEGLQAVGTPVRA